MPPLNTKMSGYFFIFYIFPEKNGVFSFSSEHFKITRTKNKGGKLCQKLKRKKR